jgi:hypothetical protein
MSRHHDIRNREEAVQVMSTMNRPGNLFERSVRLRTTAIFLLVFAAIGAVPAFGLWMPWATETDKIKKTVKDVWFGLLRADRKSVEKLLTGPAAQIFVDRELQLIQTLAITDYAFRFNKVTFDPIKGEWAWVELDRLAILKNGTSKTMPGFSTFRKLKGEWKLYVGSRNRKERNVKPREKKEQKGNSGRTAAAGAKADRKTRP